MSPDKNDLVSIYKGLLLEGVQAEIPDTDEQLSYIKRYLPRAKESRILDAGCGNGKYIFKINSLGYADVYGVDLFQDTVRIPGRYAAGSIEALPFLDGSFSMVYSNSVIFYAENPFNAVKECFRVLKPGGVMIMTAHTKYSLFTLDRIIKRKLRGSTVRHLAGVRFYSSLQYARMMRSAGFRVVETDGYRMSYLIWPFIKKILKRAGVSFSARAEGRKKRNRIYGFIRSVIGYHAVLAGYKEK
ncbi:MAG: class I SAM-dependent methyltransferase [Candidatus Omnitrophota bacterium]